MSLLDELDNWPKSQYLDTVGSWLWLLQQLKAASDAGFCTAYDTETIGCDPEEETAVYWARPVIWSIGIADGDLTARGYRKARGFVLPWQALPVFQPWLRGDYGDVWAFNARFDRHACKNLNIETAAPNGRSVVKDVLDYMRVLDPGHDSYGLKACTPRYLGYTMMGKFKDVFKLPRSREVQKKRKTCTWDESHHVGEGRRKKCEVCDSLLRIETWTEVKQLSDRFVPLQEVLGLTPSMEVTPGESELWPVAVTYAGLDAIATAEQASMLPRPPYLGEFKGSTAHAKIPELD